MGSSAEVAELDCRSEPSAPAQSARTICLERKSDRLPALDLTPGSRSPEAVLEVVPAPEPPSMMDLFHRPAAPEPKQPQVRAANYAQPEGEKARAELVTIRTRVGYVRQRKIRPI